MAGRHGSFWFEWICQQSSYPRFIITTALSLQSFFISRRLWTYLRVPTKWVADSRAVGSISLPRAFFFYFVFCAPWIKGDWGVVETSVLLGSEKRNELLRFYGHSNMLVWLSCLRKCRLGVKMTIAFRPIKQWVHIYTGFTSGYLNYHFYIFFFVTSSASGELKITFHQGQNTVLPTEHSRKDWPRHNSSEMHG